MSGRLTKHAAHRVSSAFAWAQKRMRTAFALELEVMPKEEREHAHFSIDRSGRGKADPHLFTVWVNPKSADVQSMRNLRVFAVHEIIHAILWPLSEFAETDRPQHEAELADAACEAAVYQLQRAIVGETKE